MIKVSDKNKPLCVNPNHVFSALTHDTIELSGIALHRQSSMGRKEKRL